jgi:hypothetical protein
MPPIWAAIGGDFRKDTGKYPYAQFTGREKCKALSVELVIYEISCPIALK